MRMERNWKSDNNNNNNNNNNPICKAPECQKTSVAMLGKWEWCWSENGWEWEYEWFHRNGKNGNNKSHSRAHPYYTSTCPYLHSPRIPLHAHISAEFTPKTQNRVLRQLGVSCLLIAFVSPCMDISVRRGCQYFPWQDPQMITYFRVSFIIILLIIL